MFFLQIDKILHKNHNKVRSRPLNFEICYGVRLGTESSANGVRRYGGLGGILPENVWFLAGSESLLPAFWEEFLKLNIQSQNMHLFLVPVGNES